MVETYCQTDYYVINTYNNRIVKNVTRLEVLITIITQIFKYLKKRLYSIIQQLAEFLLILANY